MQYSAHLRRTSEWLIVCGIVYLQAFKLYCISYYEKRYDPTLDFRAPLLYDGDFIDPILYNAYFS